MINRDIHYRLQAYLIKSAMASKIAYRFILTGVVERKTVGLLKILLILIQPLYVHYRFIQFRLTA